MNLEKVEISAFDPTQQIKASFCKTFLYDLSPFVSNCKFKAREQWIPKMQPLNIVVFTVASSLTNYKPIAPSAWVHVTQLSSLHVSQQLTLVCECLSPTYKQLLLLFNNLIYQRISLDKFRSYIDGALPISLCACHKAVRDSSWVLRTLNVNQ